MTKKTVLKTILGICLALLAVGVGLCAYVYTQYLELIEIGENFIKVFNTNTSAYIVTYLVTFLIVFSVFYLNFSLVRSNAIRLDSTVTIFNKIPVILTASIILSGIGAYFASGSISSAFLRYVNSEWFSLGDPIFNRDIGYYVFQRPFYIACIDYMAALTGILIAINCVSYFFIYAGYDLHNMKKIIKDNSIVTHVVVSIILFFLVKALSYQFTADEILFKQHSGITGANYVDINVWLQFYKLAPIILLLSVVITIFFALRSKLNMMLLTVCIYPVAFIMVSIIAGVTDIMVVTPNEFAVSSDYIKYNIDFTREAYQLDEIETVPYEIKNNLTADSLINNADTVNNIKLNDYDYLKGYLNQAHSIKDYYTFSTPNTTVYDINGKPTLVSVAAREIDHSKINGGELSYSDKVYKYTHGTGAVMCTDNAVTSSGLPQPVIQGIPARSTNGAPAITEPRIYYGMLNEEYCVVGTKGKEYDEIEKDGYDYNGHGGILLNLPARLLYSIKLGDFNLMFSDRLQGHSKLLINRNVLDRVNHAAPFFTYDKNPYMVIDEAGRLKWIVDVYTTSEWFPYSQYTGNYNYIRNSAKAVVDAYGGTVEFYITDRNDPIIKCYQKIYPTLFEQGTFPKDLVGHLKYPEALFKSRANIFKEYHVTDPIVFYTRSDIWTYAKERYGQQQTDVEPSYSYANLNGNKFVITVPYTKANMDSAVGWLSVDSKGKSMLIDFGGTSSGTMQIEDRIDADVNVTARLAMINADEGKVLRGNMISVPIDNNILYIEPVFISQKGKDGDYVKLEFIVAVYNDKIVCANTLSECFGMMFGINKNFSTVADESLGDIISDVISSFDNVKKYSEQNDWENYGKALNELEYSIGNLRSVTEKELTP